MCIGVKPDSSGFFLHIPVRKPKQEISWTNLCSLRHLLQTNSLPHRPRSHHGSVRIVDRPARPGLPTPAVCRPEWWECCHSNLPLHLSPNTTQCWYDADLQPHCESVCVCVWRRVIFFNGSKNCKTAGVHAVFFRYTHTHSHSLLAITTSRDHKNPFKETW